MVKVWINYFVVIEECKDLSYDWFLENLKEIVKETKNRGKIEWKENWRKIKNIFKVNKLFWYTHWNHFFFFYKKIKKFENTYIFN